MYTPQENLQRWKDEALEVIKDWDECYALLERHGLGGKLGWVKSEHVYLCLQRMIEVEKWAKKAREELDSHTFIFVDDGRGETGDELNNEEVIALCEEYDKGFDVEDMIPK